MFIAPLFGYSERDGGAMCYNILMNIRNRLVYGAAGFLTGSIAAIVVFLIELTFLSEKASEAQMTTILISTATILMLGGALLGAYYGSKVGRKFEYGVADEIEALTSSNIVFKLLSRFVHDGARTEDGYKVYTIDYRWRVIADIILIVLYFGSRHMAEPINSLVAAGIVLALFIVGYPLGNLSFISKKKRVVKKSIFIREYWFKE